MSLAAGAVVGRYTVVSSLGAGGMGEVFRAQDRSLGREVALKVLPRGLAGDPDRMTRFVREAQSTSSLNHPNIVTIYEIGEAGGYHYLATELVDGATLRELIGRGPLPVAECVRVAIQTAAALAAAHEAGIVHRDVKPENLMVRTDGLVKVLDFGLAKWHDAASPGGVDPEGLTVDTPYTRPGTLLGTVAYMSPEQARGRPVDGRTDLWSLGVVVYEMLVGRPPFESSSPVDVLADILHREPTPISLRRDDAPAELVALVGRLLAKRADERPASARDVLAELEAVPLQPGPRSAPAVGRSGEWAPPAPLVHQTSSPSGARHAIAVMPFRNLSSDPDNEYFCDGLAEDLLNALAKVDGLKVVARTSAFAFKGKRESLSEIGRILGVTTVLEGSVRTAGRRMRVAVQLANAADGFHLWSERYDRELTDIFDVQDEITLAVVDALKLRLFGEQRAAALKRGTEDPEAHRLFLKGRFCWNLRTAASLREAVDCYQRAIELDPGYALAHAGLAEAYVLFGWLSVAAPEVAMPRARAAARRALELDDSLAEAHAALGVYLSFYAWDQPASERALRRAIELDPRSATAHHWLGNIPLLAMGRWDESLAAIRRALALDPLSPSIASDLGVTLLFARRYDEAIAQFSRTLDLDPGFYVARYHLGQALHSSGRPGEAVAEYVRCREASDDPWVEALLARSLAAAGRVDEAARCRDELVGSASRRYVPNIALAVAHTAPGDHDAAFGWLERDLEERSLFPPFFAVDPVFDELRDDPRFDDLVHRVALARLDDDPDRLSSGQRPPADEQ
ncbi:MAG: protein kinase [Thermoanaerobaculales bacterium]|jgi:serine/threonine-protein kinase|nr:protein kinase [Thermoanaerobaculales bacterium]